MKLYKHLPRVILVKTGKAVADNRIKGLLGNLVKQKNRGGKAMSGHVAARNQRVQIFEDTMDWIRNSRNLTEAVRKSQIETRLCAMDEMPRLLSPEKAYVMLITVTAERSFEATMKIKRKNPNRNVAVLNFASATNPGGGVTRGSSAQEEALCRCSTLYPCLNTPQLWKDYYGFHRERHDVRYTDTCIYTPGILIIKTDTRLPERMPKENWCQVDVISCAAPNLREKPYHAMNPGQGTAVKVSDSELLALHKKRARKILTVAAANGVDSLVLGAFGCGAFQNPPEVVARAYKEILPEYQGYFYEVRFAVYCTPADPSNYDVFKRVLS